MKILVTGGCGYKGSVLIPKLLNDGHQIINLDTQWFGNNLAKHHLLRNIKGDVRSVKDDLIKEIDAIIHLANIANDPAVDLNPTLSWEVNVLASQQLASKAAKAGVRQFIYASSGSVYGIKEEENVTEDLDLIPISTYNKTKMVAERVFLSYQSDMKIHCIRPATVCGVSPRMRLDVSVNMLTYQALTNGKITVFGGNQTRPNIHIEDMANVYKYFIDKPGIDSGCYNAGFENISILEIAEMVKSKIKSEIIVTKSNDPRSYRQDSKKLLSTGFIPKKGVLQAINDIVLAYGNGRLKTSEECYSVKWMKKLHLDK